MQLLHGPPLITELGHRPPRKTAVAANTRGPPPHMWDGTRKSARHVARAADIHQDSSILAAHNGVRAHIGDGCQSTMGHCCWVAELCHTRLPCVEVCRAWPPGGGGLPRVPGSWSWAGNSMDPFWRWKYTGHGQRSVDCRENSELDSVAVDLHWQAVWPPAQIHFTPRGAVIGFTCSARTCTAGQQ